MISELSIRSISIRALVLLAVSGVLGVGCAAAADPAKMVPELTRGTPIAGSVSVKVTGGAESQKDPKTTLMTDKAMTSAVESSLEKGGVFSAVKRDGSGEYLLDINFTSDEHSGGYEMLAETHMAWKLLRNNAVVWQRTAHAKGQRTAFGLDHPASFLVYAEEDSVKDNIRTAVEWLQKANIPRN
jgi:hypothetical protein